MRPSKDQHDLQNPSSARDAIWSITVPLAIAETIVWASYYYAFPALLLIWERDLGWSKTELSLAFTLALLTSAAMAPLVGRLIDRGHAGLIFAGSALAAAGLLVLLSMATMRWQFTLIWIGLGAAMAGSLYEACFAIVTRALGRRARQGITMIALVAGFAGTVSFPSAHLLSSWLGWRGAVQVFAAAVAFIAVPLIIHASRLGEQQHAAQATKAKESVTLRAALGVVKNPLFWRLAVIFGAIAINHGVLLTHLLPIFDDRGIDANLAVVAAAMIGPMQVLGRIAMITIGRNASSGTIFVICLLSTILAAAMLFSAGSSPMLLFGFVALQGAGYGVTSIVRPLFIAEQLGRDNFGTIAGLLAIAFIGGTAISPTIAAVVWMIGGYSAVILLAIFSSAIGLLALTAKVGTR